MGYGDDRLVTFEMYSFLLKTTFSILLSRSDKQNETKEASEATDGFYSKEREMSDKNVVHIKIMAVLIFPYVLPVVPQ